MSEVRVVEFFLQKECGVRSLNTPNILFSDSATSCIILFVWDNHNVVFCHADSATVIAQVVKLVNTHLPNASKRKVAAVGAFPSNNRNALENADAFLTGLKSLQIGREQHVMVKILADNDKDQTSLLGFDTATSEVLSIPYTQNPPPRPIDYLARNLRCIFGDNSNATVLSTLKPADIASCETVDFPGIGPAIVPAAAESVDLQQLCLSRWTHVFLKWSSSTNDTALLRTSSTTPEHESPWYCDDLRAMAQLAFEYI